METFNPIRTSARQDAPTAELPTPVGAKAQRLRELEAAGIPVPAFRSWPMDLDQAVKELGFPLAVRSSADMEDGGVCSFAGQFQSYLNLQSTEQVRLAVEDCLRSAQNESVREYCRRQGVDPDALRMGVFVQQMIQPELAGVAFTLNPLTGVEEVVIEACAGLADELLQGHRAALPKGDPLLERHRSAIETLARRTQRILGTPLDMEFAVADGRVFLLQARPITKLSFAPSVGEWTNADFRDGGVSCDVCTPLMWSFYDYIWEDTLKCFLKEIRLWQGEFQAGRMFFGRPYWNLGAVKECLAQLPGFVERDFDRDLGVEVQYEGQGRVTPFTWLGLLRALPTVLAVPRVWRRQERFDRFYLGGGFQQWMETCAQLPLNTDTLCRLIHGLYHKTESNYFRTIFCASLAKLDFMEAFPDADSAALMTGLPELAHSEPVELIHRMAQEQKPDADELIRRFPHRSRRELDIRAPRWDEDREWVELLLHQAQQEPRPPAKTSQYKQLLTEATARLRPRQRRRFKRKLERLRRFVWLREEMRDLSTRVYHLLRRCVVAIAEERGLGEDIFFMRWQEILADDRTGIAAGRQTYECYRHFRAPNEIGTRYPLAPKLHTGALQGLAASPGRITATARVARTVEEAARVEAGCVLVCPFTDPGWTPVLSRVAGVVTETGGLLSHAAVICREFGIPAVLNVAEATRRVPDGTRVTLDGQAGYVEVAR